MSDYRQLRAWQRAYQLILKVYAATRAFPSDERFGLQSQMRRAAVSVAANIAEGSGRSGDGDSTRFLRIARGSLHELSCEIMVAGDLKYITTNERESLLGHADTIGSALIGLIRAQTATRTRR